VVTARRRRRRGRRKGGTRLVLLALGAAVVLVATLLLIGRSRIAHRNAAEAPPPAGHATPPARKPSPPAAPSEPRAKVRGARVALVIDDLGRSQREVDRIEALGVPVTFAVLPYERRTQEIVARLRREKREIICHLPMEPVGAQNPGPNAIFDRQDPERIAALTREALAAVPGAVGVNNHMGSRITADGPAMQTILNVVRANGLFFLDSRTTAESRAFEIARRLGIPAARRSVFLDAERSEEAVDVAFAHLLEIARREGSAIGIGHPHDATMNVLEQMVPRAVEAGYEFVPVSFLLERDEGLPE